MDKHFHSGNLFLLMWAWNHVLKNICFCLKDICLKDISYILKKYEKYDLTRLLAAAPLVVRIYVFLLSSLVCIYEAVVSYKITSVLISKITSVKITLSGEIKLIGNPFKEFKLQFRYGKRFN